MDEKTRNRLFMTQIKGISHDKKFDGIFSNVKNSLMIIKSNKEILEEKRDAYNFIYINIMNAYQIDTTGIVEELDNIWENCYSASEIFKKLYDNNNNSKNKLAYHCVKANEHINVVFKLVDINQILKEYIQACNKLANKKANEIEKNIVR